MIHEIILIKECNLIKEKKKHKSMTFGSRFTWHLCLEPGPWQRTAKLVACSQVITAASLLPMERRLPAKIRHSQ